MIRRKKQFSILTASLLLMSYFILCLICILKNDMEPRQKDRNVVTTNGEKSQDNEPEKIQQEARQNIQNVQDEVPLQDESCPESTEELIRVIICTTDFLSYYHKEIAFTGSEAINVSKSTKNGENFEVIQLEKGIEYKLNHLPELEEGESFRLHTSGRITLNSVIRQQGNSEYYGDILISKDEKGFLIRNELPLEDYLYSVVPSEMPAYYSEEALKAQAVCARTYAYDKILDGGLSEYEAHLDDSTRYQVYNNIQPDERTNHAVDATRGKIMMYDGIPVEAYYYSTSCGLSADETVWNNEAESCLSYLGNKNIARNSISKDYSNEEVFQDFITRYDSNDYEANEPFYRWNYRIDKINSKGFLNRIINRYKVSPYYILMEDQKGNYISQEPKELGDIQSIQVVKRDKSGSIDELVICGTKAKYKIMTNNEIRYVMADKDIVFHMADESERSGMTMLPSAFFSVTYEKKNGILTSYSVQGGGFGHGVGMSQNAARVMSELGRTYTEILSLFFENCELYEVYK